MNVAKRILCDFEMIGFFIYNKKEIKYYLSLCNTLEKGQRIKEWVWG